MPSPRGFARAENRRQHYAKHGQGVGAADEMEYEALATRFLGSQLVGRVQERVRLDGVIVRYDPSTDLFGAKESDGTVLTFFRVGRGHRGGLEYFRSQR